MTAIWIGIEKNPTMTYIIDIHTHGCHQDVFPSLISAKTMLGEVKIHTNRLKKPMRPSVLRAGAVRAGRRS
jgi:hypothetical protein